jgi:DUF4097 and DUF4098 domain-containing protein YvlB
MKWLFFSILLALVAFFGSGCIERFPAEYSETEHLSVALPAGGTLHVTTQNGWIRVRSGEVNEVQITAEKVVRSVTEQEAERFCKETKVVSETEVSGATISVELPEGHRRRASIAVSIEAVVPKNCSLELRTHNGEVEAQGVAGDAQMRSANGRIGAQDIGGKVVAHTSNGAVELERISGFADAETSNGSITIKEAAGDIRCETSNGRILLEKVVASAEAITSNGSITCTLPADASATVSANTTTGKVSCDFPVTIKRSRLSGKIGDGKASVSLRTSNGNIHIRKIE